MDEADGRRQRVLDVAAITAVALFVLVVIATRPPTAAPRPEWLDDLDAAAALLGCLALWWRRRAPVVLTAVLIGVSTVLGLVSVPALIGLFTVADRRTGASTAVLAVTSLLSTGVNHLLHPDPATPLTVALPAAVAVHAVAVIWGLFARSRRELIASLRERAAAAEVEARLRAERDRHEARETLAREMHDVLGHRLSLLSVHAGALTYHRDASPEEVGRAAEVVRENARRALQDLREVIGVLRAPEGDVPLPGIVDVAELVDETVGAGTSATLHDSAAVTTGTREVPSTTGRTVYRVVQEGLTNARKHAPGAAVVVRVDGTPGEHLDVEVRNEPPRGHAEPPTGPGDGLRGLRERAALVGGHLEHGPTPGGGWRLGLRLPWPP